MKNIRVYYLEEGEKFITTKLFDTLIGAELWLELRGGNLLWAGIEIIWKGNLPSGYVNVRLHGR